ncbi:MAG: HK97-gp10 family putative phage morphogenesis protein [Gemmatimonadaceae bacterium]
MAVNARFELSVQGVEGLVANIYAADPLVKNAVRAVNQRAGKYIRERTQATCAYDTGFMAEHVKDVYTPSGLAFEVGWDATDFYEAGHPFYPVWVEWGTTRQAAQPSLAPAYDEYSVTYADDLGTAIKAAISRLGTR